MAFLLGSLTDGALTGARSVMGIANDWETLKQNRIKTEQQQHWLDTDKAITAARNDPAATQAASDAASPNLSPRGGDTPAGKTYGSKDLNSLPLPKSMQPKGGLDTFTTQVGAPAPANTPASPDTGSSPREGRGVLPTDPGMYYEPNSGTMYTPKPTPALPGWQGYQGPAITSPPAAPSSSALPTGRQTPPQYIPGSGTPVTQLTPPTPSPQQTVGGVPNLANSQQGLGGQILAALSPTSRPV